MPRVPRPLRLLWDRISFSTLTKIYFAFSLVHFLVQVTIQIRALTINDRAAHSLAIIAGSGQTEQMGRPLPVLQGSTLRMCTWVSSDLDVVTCPIVWAPRDVNATAPQPALANANYDISSPARSSSTPSPEPSTTTVTRTSTVALSSPTRVDTLTATPIDTLTATSVQTLTAAPTETPVVPRLTITATLVRTTPPLLGIDTNGDGNPDTPDLSGVDLVADSNQNSQGQDENEDDEEDDERTLTPRLFKRQNQVIPQNDTDTVFIDGKQVSLACRRSLQYPISVLSNTKREDMVFIAFHFWVLGMSIVALLNESIPHVLASLVTHAMATAWAGFQISHTASFRADFGRVIGNGACNGIPLLPNFWIDRSNAEIAGLALNAFALLLSGFLTWKMIKLFGWQTFKRVGASRTINRIYKLVLTLSITLQLSLFFMIVTVSLWIDQLFNSTIGDPGAWLTLNKVLSFITLVLLIPWLMTGWFAVRRELRSPMFAFLALSVLYLGGWGFMFFSTTFRWTFLTWRFFSVMASASVALTFASAFLGVLCFYNFGRGLARYLNAHRTLPDDDPSTYSEKDDDEDKVAFPRSDQPIPTYWSSGLSDPYKPSDLNAASFDRDAKIIDTSRLAVPQPVVLPGRTGPPMRNNSVGSAKSSSSYSSYGSSGHSNVKHSRNGSQISQGRRWVIE